MSVQCSLTFALREAPVSISMEETCTTAHVKMVSMAMTLAYA